MTSAIKLWRIATETRDYKADDLSGKGAANHPGRWNATGEHVIYASQTLSLAVLETAAHINSAGLPLNRFVVQITPPSAVWKSRVTVKQSDLDPAWEAIPCGKASVDVGSAWYKSGASAVLLVPSVLVPEEWVVLINATHPDAKAMHAKTIRQFDYDRLFRSS